LFSYLSGLIGFIREHGEYCARRKIMCSVGGPMDIEIEERLNAKTYKCKDCQGTFKGIGKNIICPSCGSDNVSESV
jgi:Zn finger protein HypA/HybF involved in hydrogenase expression